MIIKLNNIKIFDNNTSIIKKLNYFKIFQNDNEYRILENISPYSNKIKN